MDKAARLAAYLLRSQLICVAALLLAAVVGLAVKTRVALAANFLVAVVLTGEDHERRLNNTSTQTKD